MVVLPCPVADEYERVDSQELGDIASVSRKRVPIMCKRMQHWRYHNHVSTGNAGVFCHGNVHHSYAAESSRK